MAIIKARVVQFATNTKKKNVSEFKHFKDNNLPRATTICRGCKVAIKGKNFNPEWGLFNSAIGTVQEIVYKNDESPNEGHLPCYVAVEFPSYTGHLHANGGHCWDKNNSQVIPIPIVTAKPFIGPVPKINKSEACGSYSTWGGIIRNPAISEVRTPFCYNKH